MGFWLMSRRLIMFLSMASCLLLSVPSWGDDYHTPLAGEEFTTVLMGKPIHILPRDRGNVSSVTFGGTFFEPPQGDTHGLPFGAVYLKRTWPTSRMRSQIGVFVNDLEYDRSVDGGELVLRLENYTLPVDQTEVVDNREIKESSVKWGTVWATAGPGIRIPVAPYQVDNDLRLQLLGRIGYFYAGTTSDTAPQWEPPPDTLLWGAKVRLRYDGLRRNILDLPHRGAAAGIDLDYFHRDKWLTDDGTRVLTGNRSRDYLQATGYALGVGGIPGLSEKNRVLGSIHLGTVTPFSADRYNVFRIGGGPLQSETDDLYRPDYPGAVFNNLLVTRYAIAALEYRRELAFFIYLHLRSTFIAAELATDAGAGQVKFADKYGVVGTFALESGFLWESHLNLAYSRDSGFIRNGEPANGVLVMWDKSF